MNYFNIMPHKKLVKKKKSKVILKVKNKKVKKENITCENIGAIMLCQIPGVSSATALTIMEKYKTIQNLIKELETNPNTLKDISSTNAKGQTRKINKSSIANIIQFLIQSEK